MRLTIHALETLIAEFTAVNAVAIFKLVANSTYRAPSHDQFLLIGGGKRNAIAPFCRLPPKKGKRLLYVKKVVKRAGPPRAPDIPYVRTGRFGTKSRRERIPQRRSLQELLAANPRQIIRMLIEDNILHDKTGRKCPTCQNGRLGSLRKLGKRGWQYRCNAKRCQKRYLAHESHPIFSTGFGPKQVSLQLQSAILLCLVNGVSQTLTSTLHKCNHKLVERMSIALDDCRTRYVKKRESSIAFGCDEAWMDVEADEVDIGKGAASARDDVNEEKPIVWEQWGGVVERGAPHTLVLTRLNPRRTKENAPGPGPIRPVDWKPIATRFLKGRKVILHTDGARAYKLRIPGVLHDHVVHMKKKIVKGGVAMWQKPGFTKTFKRTSPCGKVIYCKGGTQVIDRFWRTLRAALVGRSSPVGSYPLERRVRSCQWVYWQTGEDLWVKTGEMLSFFSK